MDVMSANKRSSTLTVMMSRSLRIAMIFAPALFLLILTAGGQPITQANGTIPQELLFPGAPLNMADENLPGALNVYSPLVVECWERGCRPCELMGPKIYQMASDFKGKIVFAKVCIDDNPLTMIKYGIERTPTLLIFNNSTLVYKHVGNYPIDDLKHIILTVLHMR